MTIEKLKTLKVLMIDSDDEDTAVLSAHAGKALNIQIDKLIDAVNELSKKLDYVEIWIENHEKNILPRFKEEILKCLEDDEFRNDFFIQLIPAMYKPLFHGCFLANTKVDTVLAESPLMPGVLQQTQTVRNVDANKTIEEPSLAYKATAINRMQSESSEFPNLKLKEAEDELELELNLFDGVLVESDIPQEKINPLRMAFENWKEARNK